MDIDPEKNPFGTGTDNPGYDEIGEMSQMTDRFPPTSSRRGSEDITNPYRHRTHEETSFGGNISNITPLIDHSTVEEQREKAWEVLERDYPNASASLIADYNKDGRLTVKMSEAKRDYILFTKNRTTGEQQINPKLPKEIQKSLGEPAVRIVEANKDEIARREKKLSELKENRKAATGADKENIDHNINEQQEQIDELERENEEIEGRMTMTDKIKTIFKKYGFTMTAVISAVTVVISVLVSNLKKGLTTLGKKLGGGLKDVGKKLGQILPGLVGAIASFIFKTAGEAIGFLAKKAYLLILAVVIYFAEKFKNRK